MPPKVETKTTTSVKSSFNEPWLEETTPTVDVSISLVLEGDPPGPGEYNFMVMFNNTSIQWEKWQDQLKIQCAPLGINLCDSLDQSIITDMPLIFLIRILGGKGLNKEPDPLISPENKAGATLDLLPLLLGEDEILTRIPIILLSTGDYYGSTIVVHAKVQNGKPTCHKVPLLITLISAHCLPNYKEGTLGIAAIGLDDIHDPVAINFGMSQSNLEAKKVVWAVASKGGYVANTAINVPNDDIFLTNNLTPVKSGICTSFYWNAMKRVLIDRCELQEKIKDSLFLIELAAVPKTGKVEVRGRYMGYVDAKVLLEPGITGVTTAVQLLYYSESSLPENIGPLLDLPATSAKVSVRDSDVVTDFFGHTSYIIIRFDIMDSLVPNIKHSSLLLFSNLPLPDEPIKLVDDLYVDPPIEDSAIDVKRIRKEGGALAVHKELSGLACRGTVPMNQSIKRTAANRLLMRVRTMLKQFPPGECSTLENQETVTAQHVASRRAVTASFAPQPPPLRMPARAAAARCKMADDERIAQNHLSIIFDMLPSHPRTLLLKALRCLEEYKVKEARTYLSQAVNIQSRNRFLLWAFGAQEFDKGSECYERASAVFRIATISDYSDGIANTVAWGALHALFHHKENIPAAFVAAKNMRKSFEINQEWPKFLQRWIETSGEEETLWTPTALSINNPLLLTSAFFLCLRCYNFSDIVMKCAQSGCATRGSHVNFDSKLSPDFYYVIAASYLLRRRFDKALHTIEIGIQKFGPSAIMSQIRTTCLMFSKGWSKEVECAFGEMERAGTQPCLYLLLKAATNGMKTDPKMALQRAAYVHKIAPGGHSALVIAQIYNRLNDNSLAERWAAAAVKVEPLLADAWALLGILAMRERDVDKARTMLRTARQVGPISPTIQEEIDKLTIIVEAEDMPEALEKDLCLCDYY